LLLLNITILTKIILLKNADAYVILILILNTLRGCMAPARTDNNDDRFDTLELDVEVVVRASRLVVDVVAQLESPR